MWPAGCSWCAPPFEGGRLSMEQLRLMIPDISLAEEIRAYRADMLKAGSSMDGCGSLRRHEDPADWLAFNGLLAHPDTVPAGLVPSTQYVCVNRQGRILGMIQLRHAMNDYLRLYAGHIGYSVRPDERRKGYAAWMLRAVLEEARARGMERVMVSCLTDNEGSRRTILASGGVYESTVHEPKENVDIQRYWIGLGTPAGQA